MLSRIFLSVQWKTVAVVLRLGLLRINRLIEDFSLFSAIDYYYTVPNNNRNTGIIYNNPAQYDRFISISFQMGALCLISKSNCCILVLPMITNLTWNMPYCSLGDDIFLVVRCSWYNCGLVGSSQGCAGSGYRYSVKFGHPALSGKNLPDIYRIVLLLVRYFVTTMKRKSLLGV